MSSLKKLKTGRWQVRWRDSTGKQRAENFRSKELAQEKLRALHRGETDDRAQCAVVFSDVVADWKRDRYPSISPSTRIRYNTLLRLYFESLMPKDIRQITPAVVDDWIRWLKEDLDRFGKGSQRTSFKKELELLKTVLNYYAEYRDDPSFMMPLKRRHAQDVRIRHRRQARPKDLSELDFLAFRQRLEADFELESAAMATLQFYNALRISEAVALRWEDIRFNWQEPRKSRIVFSQHVVYTRSKEVADHVEPGFKNSEEGKEHPMLPEVFGMLRRMYRPGAKGLVFTPPEGSGQEFFSYRQVQYRYNAVFQRLGLPYTSTHIMRHGGTRKTFDETGGDEGIAAQQLGNTAAVKVYAKRSVHAFTQYALSQWDRASDVHSTKVEAK